MAGDYEAAFGWVYIVCDPTGPLKIGSSLSPKKRLLALQWGNPRRLSLARAWEFPTLEDAVEIEQGAQSALHYCALEIGEWFAATVAQAAAAVEDAAAWSSARQAKLDAAVARSYGVSRQTLYKRFQKLREIGQ